MQSDRFRVPFCRNCRRFFPEVNQNHGESVSQVPVMVQLSVCAQLSMFVAAVAHKSCKVGGRMHAKFCMASIRSNKCGKAEQICKI